MCSEAELFHDAMYKHGGRLNLSQIAAPADESFRQFLVTSRGIVASASSQLPTLPPIYLDLVADPEVQARAFTHKGRYFIAINAGVLVVVHRLFQRALSHPEILPTVGEARLEVSPVQLGAVGELLLIAHGPSPVCPVRKAYGFHLANIALQFLVCHELAHIVNGHLDYLMHTAGITAMPEKGWEPSGVNDALMRQTLEMDADCIAASNGISRIRYNLAHSSSLGSPQRELYVNASQCLFDWSFAISSYFRLFGDDTIQGSALDRRLHPPFRARQIMAHSTGVTHVMEKWDKNLAEPFIAATKAAIPAVENAFIAMVPDSLAIGGLQEADTEVMHNYVATLIMSWKNHIRNALEPFAYGSLPE